MNFPYSDVDVGYWTGMEQEDMERWFWLGMEQEQAGQLDKAQDSYLRMFTIAAMLGNDLAVALSLMKKGDVHFKQRKVQDAEKAYIKALEISWKIGIVPSMAICYYNLIPIFETLGNIREAKDACQQAIYSYNLLGEHECVEDACAYLKYLQSTYPCG